MKKFILILLFLSFKNIQAQYVTIPDSLFRAYLDTAYPSCMFNHMLDTTCPAVLNATYLVLRDKEISSMEGIQYFRNVTYCEVSDDLADTLYFPCFPPKTETLELDVSHVRSFPPLPAGLKNFYCDLCFLTTVPPLPDSLYELNIGNNSLIKLPPLPNSIRILGIAQNMLTSLPKLPDSLSYLSAPYNHLTSLPPLPNSLELMYIYFNQLTSLPALPSKLSDLQCFDNPELSCLPRLPYNMSVLYVKHTKITCLPNFINPNAFLDTAITRCPNNNSTCNVNPFVQGRIYSDDNHNGVYDSLTEKLLPGYLVNVLPAGWVSASDSSGEYIVKLDTMLTNTWSCVTRKYEITTPPSYSFNPGNNLGLVNGNFDFGIYFQPDVYDLQAQLSSSTARPGFITTVTAGILNVGTVSQDNVTVKMKVPAGFSPLLPPSSVSGDTLIWNGLHIDSLNEGSIMVQFLVPVSDTLGTPLTYEMWVIGNPADSTPADNHTTWTETIRGSYDPNDKSVNVTSLPPNYDADKNRLIYTIRFQNTGTLAADFVMVRDIIPSNLDISSLQILNASHPYQLCVRDKNIVEVVFPNIQLPDSLTSETFSHGFVQLSFKPKPGLPVNTQIDNNASIYFDYNAPVVTNTATTKVQITTGIINNKKTGFKLYPNPAAENITVKLQHAAIVKWKLYDVSGKIIKSGVESTTESFDVDVHDLSTGTFILTVETDGEISGSKVMIAR